MSFKALSAAQPLTKDINDAQSWRFLGGLQNWGHATLLSR